MDRRARRRPPVKQDEILAAVRSRIVRGNLKPGDQLPTHLEIAHKFKTTGVTAQRAYERLVEEGFVVVRGRQGTFVVERPPHLHRFILAIPHDRSGQWVRFWTVLESSARAMTDAGTHWIEVRTGIDSKRHNGDYDQLLDDVRTGNLAGILFATNPHLVRNTPLLDNPGLSRVALMTPPAPPGVTAMVFGSANFLERAVDHLVSLGRKKIAFLLVPGFTDNLPNDIERLLASRGLTRHPLWIQMTHQSLAEWTGHLTHLLVSAPPTERPDGLVIVDDNLVEHACAGLLRAGLRLSNDIDVVAHCNFPAPSASALPIARLGYDIPRILEYALDVMKRQRTGEPVADVLHILPQFEWEVDKDKTDSAKRA